LTDVDVAATVGAPCVAYANEPEKRTRFAGSGALVIESMSELTAEVTEWLIRDVTPVAQLGLTDGTNGLIE
jgi:hypothetical protein